MRRMIPTTPLAMGLSAVSLWRRLSPTQRRMLLRLARTHGPRVAAATIAAAKARKKR